MPAVQKKDRENFEVMLRRFRRACDNAGIINRCRFLESYEKPTWARKRKKATATKRQVKMNRYNQFGGIKKTH